MATNTAMTLPSMYPQTLSDIDLDSMNRVQQAYSSQAGRDNRSSSLSEIGDRADQEHVDSITYVECDANDTEAETERLEDSPQKQRKHQNIVLTATNDIDDEHQLPQVDHRTQEQIVQNGKFGAAFHRLVKLISIQTYT